MAVTFDIPGGQATMIDNRDEVKPRRRREVELIASRVGTVVIDAAQAARVFCGEDLVIDQTDVVDKKGKPVFSGDVHITEHQLRMMGRLTDAITWALLIGWTLPEPLPADPDALLDVDAPVFDALRQKAAELNATMGDGGFTVDAVEDRESPTGDSDASGKRLSLETGQASTPSQPAKSANTATGASSRSRTRSTSTRRSTKSSGSSA